MSQAFSRLRRAGLIAAFGLLVPAAGWGAEAKVALTTPSSEALGSVTIRVFYDGAKVSPIPVDPKQPERGLSVAPLHPIAMPETTLVAAAPVIGGLPSLRVVALSGTEEGIEPPGGKGIELLSLGFDAVGAASDVGEIHASVERASDRLGRPLDSLPGVAIQFVAVPEPAGALIQAASLASLGLLAARRWRRG